MDKNLVRTLSPRGGEHGTRCERGARQFCRRARETHGKVPEMGHCPSSLRTQAVFSVSPRHQERSVSCAAHVGNVWTQETFPLLLFPFCFEHQQLLAQSWSLCKTRDLPLHPLNLLVAPLPPEATAPIRLIFTRERLRRRRFSPLDHEACGV